MPVDTPLTALPEPLVLERIGDELLEAAAGPAGRAARTLLPGGGAPLKQTLMALLAGRSLQDHTAPGPASLLVLRGTVVLGCGDEEREVAEGSWTPIPREAHRVEARTDAVLLVTVAPAVPGVPR